MLHLFDWLVSDSDLHALRMVADLHDLCFTTTYPQPDLASFWSQLEVNSAGIPLSLVST